MSGSPVGALFFTNGLLLALAVIVLLVAGGAALESLPRLEDPVIARRNPLVLTLVPGASAERVEALVTKPIEDALGEISEIKTLASSSRAGFSLVSVELRDSVTSATNEAVFSRIRDALRGVDRLLPPEAMQPEFDDKRGAVAFTLLVAVNAGEDGSATMGVLNRHASAIADRLRNLGGTELVRVYGAAEEEIRVDLDPVALAGLGMGAADVSNVIRAADTKSPAGVLHGPRAQLALEVEAEPGLTERIAGLPLLARNDGGLVHVRDVATVVRSWREPVSSMAEWNGRRTVFVAARVRPDQRVDKWSASALKVVGSYRSEVGRGVGVDVVFDQSVYTEGRLGELLDSLLVGAAVVVVVVLMIMGWRAALIVGSALPLTAAATLFLLSVTGGSIQQMSVFGMIVALGLLIDNAIVMTDEVRSRILSGHSPRNAVSGATRHLFVPLLSSSLTTILAFAPILLLPGNAGDFVGSIGSSVILSIATSFVIAMTVIAAFAGRFGRPADHRSIPKRGWTWWRNGVNFPVFASSFRKWLRLAMMYPWIAVGFSVAIPASGFFAASRMNLEFFPPTDRNMFTIRVWLPENSSISATAAVMRNIAAEMRGQPEVEEVLWFAGGSFPSIYYNLVMFNDNNSGFGQAIVVTSSAADVNKLLALVQREMPVKYPEAQIVANSFGQGPPVEAEIEIRITGENLDSLRGAGQWIRSVLEEDDRVQTTRTSLPDGSPKIWFVPDRAEIQLAGWTPARIASEMQFRLDGHIGGTVLEDLESMDVRIRLASPDRSTPESLRDMTLPTADGGWIPLEALGRLKFSPERGVITRRNRERVNTVQGFTVTNALPIEVSRSVIEKLNDPGAPPLPPGIRIEVGGNAENQSDAVGNLALYLPIFAVMTLGILVLSFRSVIIAGILVASAFLSVGFGLLASWLCGFPLSFNSILGSLGVVGLAFNASIVVIAAIRAQVKADENEIGTIVEAVSGCGRHLCSTTLTTIGGCLPLLIFIGGDFWPPLAIVLVAGVGGSTLLALFFTPVLFGRFVQGLSGKYLLKDK